jgi:precorrin-2 methylase
MAEDVFEKQLRSVQMKRTKKEQRRSFRRIDAEIQKLSNAWMARIMAEMQEAITKESDAETRETMEWAMSQYLDGFAEGYALGFLRLGADEE